MYGCFLNIFRYAIEFSPQLLETLFHFSEKRGKVDGDFLFDFDGEFTCDCDSVAVDSGGGCIVWKLMRIGFRYLS